MRSLVAHRETPSRGGSNSWISTVAVPKQSTQLICSVARWLRGCQLKLHLHPSHAASINPATANGTPREKQPRRVTCLDTIIVSGVPHYPVLRFHQVHHGWHFTSGTSVLPSIILRCTQFACLLLACSGQHSTQGRGTGEVRLEEQRFSDASRVGLNQRTVSEIPSPQGEAGLVGAMGRRCPRDFWVGLNQRA